jgi:carbon storage regulator CsrA
MWVILRQKGERIVIGNTIVVEVVDILRGKVQLRVTAPADVPVVRAESYGPFVAASMPPASQFPLAEGKASPKRRSRK